MMTRLTDFKTLNFLHTLSSCLYSLSPSPLQEKDSNPQPADCAANALTNVLYMCSFQFLSNLPFTY